MLPMADDDRPPNLGQLVKSIVAIYERRTYNTKRIVVGFVV